VTTTAPPAAALAAPAPAARGGRRLLAPAALLAATAVLHLWGLSASGWGNSFYAAAAQAGGESWTAWFFGSSDAANAITVDKTPGALWVTGLSVRLFGLSSWSVLVPQALMGVAAVGLLHATVARTAGRAAGLLAGAALALTPVAVLMFRFNNPDALLVLLLVAAAWATLRAVERGGTRWLLLAGVLVGCGFLTKMLQAFLVLPALTLVWLVAAPVGIKRRLRDLVLAGLAVLASAGWWVAVVELWPADSRPYVGGSQTDSVLELVLGYNGLGRLTGDETGSVGGGAGGGPGGGWGETGPLRLFDTELGGQAAWLLPAALVLLAALLWMRRRAPRTDPLRAAALLWGGWLLVTGTVFSLMEGIFHAYYLVALAPAVAALVGTGAVHLWRARSAAGPRAVLAGTLLLTAVWAFVLLRRTPDWLPWLAWTVLVAGAVAAAALLVVHLAPRAVVAATLALAVAAGLAGPAAYSLVTAATPHSGPLPTAGPAGAGGPGGPDGPGGPRPDGVPAGAPTEPPPGGAFPGAFPGGGPDGDGPGGGAMGALFGGSEPSAEVVALLQSDAGAHTWVAAAVGSLTASGYQLAVQEPVLAVGGFNGTDPSPTLAEFQELVAAGRVRWFIGSSSTEPSGLGGAGPGGAGPGGTASSGSDAAQQIARWVAAEFPATTVDGVVLHDLSG
jgi:4-amino-4-deoxy-L-arabinose transferase-like glycosyltransferase